MRTLKQVEIIEALSAINKFITEKDRTESFMRSMLVQELVDSLQNVASYSEEVYKEEYLPLVKQSELFYTVNNSPTFESLFEQRIKGTVIIDDDFAKYEREAAELFGFEYDDLEEEYEYDETKD